MSMEKRAQEGIIANDHQVWIYKGFLDGRKVFAILKSERIRFNQSSYLWSFWKTEGGYTKDTFLVAARKDKRLSQSSTRDRDHARWVESPRTTHSSDMLINAKVFHPLLHPHKQYKLRAGQLFTWTKSRIQIRSRLTWETK